MKPLEKKHRVLLRKRGLDPDHYLLLKELNYAVFLVDQRDKTVKVVDKRS